MSIIYKIVKLPHARLEIQLRDWLNIIASSGKSVGVLLGCQIYNAMCRYRPQ